MNWILRVDGVMKGEVIRPPDSIKVCAVRVLSNTHAVQYGEHGREGAGIIRMRVGVCSKRWVDKQGGKLLTLGLSSVGALVCGTESNSQYNDRGGSLRHTRAGQLASSGRRMWAEGQHRPSAEGELFPDAVLGRQSQLQHHDRRPAGSPGPGRIPNWKLGGVDAAGRFRQGLVEVQYHHPPSEDRCLMLQTQRWSWLPSLQSQWHPQWLCVRKWRNMGGIRLSDLQRVGSCSSFSGHCRKTDWQVWSNL